MPMSLRHTPQYCRFLLNRLLLALKTVGQGHSVCAVGLSLAGATLASLTASPAALARSEKAVLLQYRRETVEVPLSDLEQLATAGITSEALDAYLDTISLSAGDLAALLDFEIYTDTIPISSTNVDFAAIQISRFIGDSLGRERYTDMRQALIDAFRDDRAVTVIEIIENYPDTTTRLSLDQIAQQFEDLALFIGRVEPILEVIRLLLPELVCDCGIENRAPASAPAENLSRAGAIAWKQACTSTADLNPGSADSKGATLPHAAPLLAQSQPVPAISDESSRPAQSSPPIVEQVVIAFGPLRPSFAIDDLQTFIATGEMPRPWRLYLRVAGLTADEFRTALSHEFGVDLLFLDDWLNNILGEYLLFQVGNIIRTRSGEDNIQALRSALVLSAADDGKVSLFEFLQRYPNQQVIVEGQNLARLGRNLSRRGAVGTATAGVADLLLQLQADVANNICDCGDTAPGDSPVSSDPESGGVPSSATASP